MRLFEYNCFKPAEYDFSKAKENISFVCCPVFGKKPQPTQRSHHAVCIHKDEIFMHGGRGPAGTLNEFWVYKFESSSWHQVHATGDIPPPLEGHTMVIHKGHIYVFGGETSFAYAGESPLWKFDISGSKWTKVYHDNNPMAPCGRRHHTAVLHNNAMYIHGGYQDLIGPTKEMWSFKFETLSWQFDVEASSATAPDARYGHCSVVNGPSMWVCGGLTGLKTNSDVYIWNFDLRLWIAVKTKGGPSELSGHAGCLADNNIYVFGGRTSSTGESSNDMWSLSILTRVWSKCSFNAAIKPPAITGHSVIVRSKLCSTKRTEVRSSSVPNMMKRNNTKAKLPVRVKAYSVSCGALPNDSLRRDEEESKMSDEWQKTSDKQFLIPKDLKNDYAFDNPVHIGSDDITLQPIEESSVKMESPPNNHNEVPYVTGNGCKPRLQRIKGGKSLHTKNPFYQMPQKVRVTNGKVYNFSNNLIRDSFESRRKEPGGYAETSFSETSSYDESGNIIIHKANDFSDNHALNMVTRITVKPYHALQNEEISESITEEFNMKVNEDKCDGFYSEKLSQEESMKEEIGSLQNSIIILGGRACNVYPYDENPFCMWKCTEQKFS